MTAPDRSRRHFQADRQESEITLRPFEGPDRELYIPIAVKVATLPNCELELIVRLSKVDE